MLVGEGITRIGVVYDVLGSQPVVGPYFGNAPS
jgi:rRNA processing protein Gar1